MVNKNRPSWAAESIHATTFREFKPSSKKPCSEQFDVLQKLQQLKKAPGTSAGFVSPDHIKKRNPQQQAAGLVHSATNET